VNYLDLNRGEADLALRWRAASGADLVSVASLRHSNSAFAAKDYAAKLPKRYGMKDVDWIAWAPPYEQTPPNPQLQALLPDFTPSFTSDNFLVMISAAMAGAGAIVLGQVNHRFRRPSPLVPLALDLHPYRESELHLVAPKSALDIPRVRLVADALAEELARARS
jgi:DNA-binding transcriptional LysR family regulator